MKVFWLAFLGKLAATAFLAACAFYGFGPEKWVRAVLPPGIGDAWLLAVRIAFLVCGAAAIVIWAVRRKKAHDATAGSGKLDKNENFLPAKKAVTYAYDRLHKTEWGSYFRGWSREQTEEEKVITGCHMLVNHGVPAYGKEPLSTEYRPVNTGDVAIEMALWTYSSDFEDGVALRVRNHPERILYRHISFLNKDLDALIEREQNA
jgi:hypothetical protein